jgi:predicted KAP-like P-loop ATPase
MPHALHQLGDAVLITGSQDDRNEDVSFHGDRPIERRKEDKLDRARFAEALAWQLVDVPAEAGFVVGLLGTWGSGKTSILNMVEEVLTDTYQDTVVLHFNPWLFSGTEQLVSRFFEELGAQLLEEPDDRLRRLGTTLEEYGQLLSPLRFVPVAGSWIDRSTMVMKAVGGFFRRRGEQGPVSVEARRHALDAALRDLGKRMVVIIDDIDRLLGEEIQDVVRLVRLTADFPLTVYLLAFDRVRVEQALGEAEGDGRAYLEKILQVSHDVPVPHEVNLAEILASGVDSIIQQFPHGPYDNADLQNVFNLVVRPLFTSLRDVRRYLNALPVTLQVVGEEVSATDVLALEGVRVLTPDVFALLPSAVGALTSAQSSYLGDQQNQARIDEMRAKVNELIEAGRQHSGAIREMCTRLFPSSQQYFSNTSYGADWHQTWRKNRRVAHPDVLRSYLEKRLPSGVLPARTVQEIFESLGDEEKLASLLFAMDPRTLEHALERLLDYENDYPPSAVAVAVRVLMNQGDRLREGRERMWDEGADTKLRRVVLRLLRRVDDEAERTLLLKTILPRIDSLSARTTLVQLVGHREHMGHGLVSAEDASWMEQDLCAGFVRTPMEQLATERQLLQVLGWLVDIDGEKVKEHARLVIGNDSVFLQMLRSGLSEDYSQTLGDIAARSEARLAWEWMASICGEDLLIKRIRDLEHSNERRSLDERTALALETAICYADGHRPDHF